MTFRIYWFICRQAIDVLLGCKLLISSKFWQIFSDIKNDWWKTYGKWLSEAELQTNNALLLQENMNIFWHTSSGFPHNLCWYKFDSDTTIPGGSLSAPFGFVVSYIYIYSVEISIVSLYWSLLIGYCFNFQLLV